MTPPPPPSAEQVGVLLPLQLETKFLPPDPPTTTSWTMLLRVIPQPPSIDRHTEHITIEELRAMTLFRRSLGSVDALTTAWFGTEAHREDFAVLARSVGAARAVWLALQAPAAIVDGEITAVAPPSMPGMHPPVVRGLPPRLHVGAWTYDQGLERPITLGSLPESPDRTIANELALPDLSTRESVLDHWVANWDAAVDVGLGGSFPLPGGLTPTDLGGVCVWGIGDEPAAPLWERHILAGALGELPLGSPTNSVAGAARDDGTPDEQAWWETLLQRMGGGGPTSLDDVLSRHVTGSPIAGMPRVRGRDAVLAETEIDDALLAEYVPEGEQPDVRDARAQVPAETRLSALLMHALWPALWGSFGTDEWALDSFELGALGRWAIENVSPQGPLPAVRVDDEAYGLLPVTRLDSWGPSSDDPPGLPALVTALAGLRRRLHARLVEGGTVRRADRGRYAALLGRGGSSRYFGARRSVRIDLLHGPPEWPGWDRRYASRADELDALGLVDPVLTPFVETSLLPDAVDLPLVQPRLSTSWGTDEVFYRVPLPGLLDTVLRASGARTLLPDPGGPATSLARLFTKDVIYSGESVDGLFRGWLSVVPDSLLARLLLQSCFTVNEWAARGVDPPHLGPGLEGGGWVLAVQQIAAMIDPHQGSGGPPAGDIRDWTRVTHGDGHPVLPGSYLPAFPAPAMDAGRRARLERAFGATLDTFSTRIDPWITGIAWRRLRTIAADVTPADRRLGAYGWAYGPFDGTPGPTASGLLHTPTQGQTLVTTLARDNFRESLRSGRVNERNEPPWALAMTGSSTRVAYDLVADMREGHHLYEILGREVERIVTADAASPYQTAVAIRTAFPMHRERPDERQVSDGFAALDGLLAGAALPEPLTPAQRSELETLRAAIDALGDLALLDGALASASRLPGRAAAALDGASGSNTAAEPEFPRTPASGRELRTAVLSVIPWRGPEQSDSGARRAEPSVAAFLESQLGTDWAWLVQSEDGTSGQVTLTRLGLRPVDTLAISSAQLRAWAAAAHGVRGTAADPLSPPSAGARDEARGRFAVAVVENENRAWDIVVAGERVGGRALASLGLAPGAVAALPHDELRRLVLESYFSPQTVPENAEIVPVPLPAAAADRVWTVRDQLGTVLGVFDAEKLGLTEADRQLRTEELEPRIRAAAGAPAATITDPPELSRAARLCALLGTPATEQDLRGDEDPVSAPTGYDDLRARYVDLHGDLEWTVGRLREAAQAPTDDAERIAAIRRGALWGITPDMTPADAATFAAVMAAVTPPEGATPLPSLAVAMADDLEARRAGAPEPPKIPTTDRHKNPLEDHPDLRNAGLPDGVISLARALSRLAAPQGNLPVLSTWQPAALSSAATLQEVDAASFEADWLTVVSAVRPPLARLEAYQLDASARGTGRLAVWANTSDPWQKGDVQARAEASHGVFGMFVPRFVAAIGPADALGSERLAVGVLDSYTETVPLRRRDTHAAFGFNAPLARAPQAILLAVPPNPGDPLTDADIEIMLRELRELMVSRTATMTDRADDSFVTRTTWLPADEGVEILDPTAHFLPS